MAKRKTVFLYLEDDSERIGIAHEMRGHARIFVQSPNGQCDSYMVKLTPFGIEIHSDPYSQIKVTHVNDGTQNWNQS